MTTSNLNPDALSVEMLMAALLDVVARGHGHLPVEVPYNPGVAHVGGTPAKGIRGVSLGFDWDHGRVFVHTTEPLGANDERFQALGKRADELAFKQYRARSILTNAALSDTERVAQLTALFADPRATAPTKVTG